MKKIKTEKLTFKKVTILELHHLQKIQGKGLGDPGSIYYTKKEFKFTTDSATVATGQSSKNCSPVPVGNTLLDNLYSSACDYFDEEIRPI